LSDKFETAKKDVGRTYSAPQDIVARKDLSREQKIELLKQWELDLREKMVAAEEGMLGANMDRDTAWLGLIHSLLAGLGYTGADSSPVNKAGG
jgi:hypothetical protein